MNMKVIYGKKKEVKRTTAHNRYVFVYEVEDSNKEYPYSLKIDMFELKPRFKSIEQAVEYGIGIAKILNRAKPAVKSAQA